MFIISVFYKSDNSISPFTQDAIDYAMEKSDRIPGKFLKLLYIVIEKAIKHGWKEIGKEQVNLTWQDETEQTMFTPIDDFLIEKELAQTKVIL